MFDGLEDLANRIDDPALDVVLHIAPETAAGGPLALVETGDRIRMSVAPRTLDLLVDDATLARRRAAWRAPEKPRRGWDRIVADQVLQADEGCDLAVMRAGG